jgi:hypothetical protein
VRRNAERNGRGESVSLLSGELGSAAPAASAASGTTASALLIP